MSVLLDGLLLLVAATGGAVAFARVPRHQVIAIAANGIALSLLFMAFQAPDVAFAELAAGSAITPLLFLVVLASVRADLVTRRVQRPGSDGDQTGGQGAGQGAGQGGERNAGADPTP